jgi:hypothetical protein
MKSNALLFILIGTVAYAAGSYRTSRVYQEAQARFYARVLMDNLITTHRWLSMSNDEGYERGRTMIRASSRGLEDVLADWDGFVKMSKVDIMETYASLKTREIVHQRIIEVLERWGYDASIGRQEEPLRSRQGTHKQHTKKSQAHDDE